MIQMENPAMNAPWKIPTSPPPAVETVPRKVVTAASKSPRKLTLQSTFIWWDYFCK